MGDPIETLDLVVEHADYYIGVGYDLSVQTKNDRSYTGRLLDASDSGCVEVRWHDGRIEVRYNAETGTCRVQHPGTGWRETVETVVVTNG